MNREEHLQWCKDRAIEYTDAGDVAQALASFTSDVAKHPETERIQETIVALTMPLMILGQLSSPHQMREHILGFN